MIIAMSCCRGKGALAIVELPTAEVVCIKMSPSGIRVWGHTGEKQALADNLWSDLHSPTIFWSFLDSFSKDFNNLGAISGAGVVKR